MTSYLQDFHCNNLIIELENDTKKSMNHPISDFISYDALSSSYKHLILNILSNFELESYHQAIWFPHRQIAMREELGVMESNHTSSTISLPLRKHKIGCHWIYKIKYHSDGSIERYKARLVAKG